MSVEFQPVALDLVPRGSRKLTHEVAHSTVIEILHLSTASADKVVVVLRAMRETVMKAPVVQKHPANSAKFREKPYRAEDGGAAGPPAPVQEIVDGKMALLLEDSCEDGASRRCYAIPARL